MDKYQCLITEIEIRIELLNGFIRDCKDEEHKKILEIRRNEYEGLHFFAKTHEDQWGEN